jgi:succinate dehydrogenase/fumarate reductase-like Fe-S protein
MSIYINAKVLCFNPAVDKEPAFRSYRVPYEKGMSAMNVLDYIYQQLDSTVAYYDHAGCALGICAKCTGRINGKAGLFCQTYVDGDVTLEPVSVQRILKDLVVNKGKKE